MRGALIMKSHNVKKEQPKEGKKPSSTLKENTKKEKVGGKGRLKQLLELGISGTAARKIIKKKLTLEDYIKKQEQIKKWEEEAEKLSEVYNIKKDVIFHHILMEGRSIEEYVEKGKLREEAMRRSLEETGHLYLKECLEQQIPLLLACHKAKWRIGLIEDMNVYDIKFYDYKKKQREWVEKLQIKYFFRAVKGVSIKDFFSIEETVKEKGIEPAKVSTAERYHIADDLLKGALDAHHRVRIISNEGEIFEGLILWFDRFHIQVELAPDILILFFRHAVCDFAGNPGGDVSGDAASALAEIIIPEEFLKTPPRKEGVQEMIEYYTTHGKLDKAITVRAKDKLLVDGYKRYVAAKKLGLRDIPVRFV
jgi:hypothetical protein